MNLFCELTCSPHQSQFTKASKFNGSNVIEVQYYIGKTFASGEFSWVFLFLVSNFAQKNFYFAQITATVGSHEKSAEWRVSASLTVMLSAV